MQSLPPRWALKTAQIQADNVVQWVECARGNQWFAPLLILTADELIFAHRGFVRKQIRRIPKYRVSSVDYNTGVIRDTFTLKVEGADLPNWPIKVHRRRRADAQALLDKLRQF